MKKLLKIVGGILALLIIAVGIYYFANNESLPEGVQGEKADALAKKM